MVALKGLRVNWILGADITSFFEARVTGFSGRDMDALPTSIYHGPKTAHPYSVERLASRTDAKAIGVIPHVRICAGGQVTAIPTATSGSRNDASCRAAAAVLDNRQFRISEWRHQSINPRILGWLLAPAGHRT